MSATLSPKEYFIALLISPEETSHIKYVCERDFVSCMNSFANQQTAALREELEELKTAHSRSLQQSLATERELEKAKKERIEWENAASKARESYNRKFDSLSKERDIWIQELEAVKKERDELSRLLQQGSKAVWWEFTHKVKALKDLDQALEILKSIKESIIIESGDISVLPSLGVIMAHVYSFIAAQENKNLPPEQRKYCKGCGNYPCICHNNKFCSRVFLELRVVAVCRDGGTQACMGMDGKEYHIDGRIGSTTIGRLFDRYPGHEGAEMLDIPFKIKR